MSAKTLEEFSRVRAAGFRCYAAPGGSESRFVARVKHVLNPPASQKAIEESSLLLGGYAPQATACLKRHNGFVLYRDTLSDAAGIELLPAEHWEEATQDMRYMFEHLADDPENDPDHIVTGIAFATVPHSGNYFVIPVAGPTAGKVFYANHDGWYESAFAADFNSFLVRVTRHPAKLLAEELGCYTRYSDGKTDLQWIPEEYFEDVTKVADGRT
jgi:hypothetical protein